MGRKKGQKKQKLEIVFDEKSRRDFLTGFRKRKNERKKKAKQELEVLLKEEKKRIRLEVKDSVKHFKKSFEPIPELQHLLEEEEYENEEVKVQVINLSTDDIASRMNLIGANKPRYDGDQDESDDNNSEADNEENKEIVPGMNLVEQKVRVVKPSATVKTDIKKITSKKDLNRLTRKTSVRSIKHNRLLKMKVNLDRVANKKKAAKEKRRQDKENAKLQRRKGKFKRK